MYTVNLATPFDKPLKLITLQAIYLFTTKPTHVSVRLILSSILYVVQNDASFTFPADFTKAYDIRRSLKSLPPIRSCSVCADVQIPMAACQNPDS